MQWGLTDNFGAGNCLVPSTAKPYMSQCCISSMSPNGIIWAQRVDNTGLILGLHSANERCHYKVMPSLIGCAQTYNQSSNT